MHTDPSRLERRAAQRFEANLPLTIHYQERTFPGFTQDISGRGIFFYTDTVLPQGAIVQLTFTMPSEITLADSMPVRCRGRVLRSSASQGGQRNGIAVRFDAYDYSPADEPLPQFVRVSAAGAGGTSSGFLPR